MPDFRHITCLLIGGLLLALAGSAQAHQVPVMQIEAEFFKNRNYSLRINLDPRVFLSEQPSSLPPVPASWYREQTPEQLQATEKAAMAYLRKNVELQFDTEKAPLPECTLVAIDGATNQPISEETEEVHLLARAHTTVPASGRNFSINLGRETGVSVILLNSMKGDSEIKPRVVFPGESSEPFPLTGMRTAVNANARAALDARLKAESPIWMLRFGIAAALVVVYVVYNLSLKKRRQANLATRRRGR
jgi:hypothetical protein